MLVNSVCRGEQLEKMRAARQLTDVTLLVDGLRFPAHKLILSLHSHYFRGLFFSKGFLESEKDVLEMTSIKSHILLAVLRYLYTGQLTVEDLDRVELASQLLWAESMLGLEDAGLRTSLEGLLLQQLARPQASIEMVMELWNLAVLHNLARLQEAVYRLLDMRLEAFLLDQHSRRQIARLGYEEVLDILKRPTLCVTTEATLLELCLAWAAENMQEGEDSDCLEYLMQLLQYVRVHALDRRKVLARIVELVPQVRGELQLRNQLIRLPRRCLAFHLLIEYKLSRHQLRNIEDFVDSGEKSVFAAVDLNTRSQRKMTELTSNSSLCGTCNANYFRPVTKGSVMLSHAGKLVVLGGEQDSGGKLQARWWRKDALLYDPALRAWQPPIKNVLQPSKSYREFAAELVLDGGELMYIVYRGSNSRPNQEREEVFFIDKIQTSVLDEGGGAASPGQLLANVPDWMRCEFVGCLAGGSTIFLLTVQKTFSCLDLKSMAWHRLPPPIGDIGPEKPLLAASGTSVYLLTGKPEGGNPNPTNTVQVYDIATRCWRLLCQLSLRFSPTAFILHSSQLVVCGWCPAKKNFILSISAETGDLEELMSGLEGVWSTCMILHTQDFPRLLT